MNDRVKRICAINRCSTTNLKKDISLFQFPQDETRCKIWAKACGVEREFNILRENNAQLRNTYKRVCGIHFEDRYFKSYKRKRLSDDAIPTLHLSGKVETSTESLLCTEAIPSSDEVVLGDHSYCAREVVKETESIAVSGPSVEDPSLTKSQSTETERPVAVEKSVTCKVGDEQPGRRKRQLDQVSQTPISMLRGAYDVQIIRSKLKAARLKMRVQARTIKRLEVRYVKLKEELQSRPEPIEEQQPPDLPIEIDDEILRQVEAKLGRKGLR